MMDRIYLPTLHWFAMKNPFTGSFGDFRYRIVPEVTMATPKEVDFENSSLSAQFWHGPFCYEKSTVEGESTFPLTEKGRNDLKEWLANSI
ncbi:MAG: hypothetical protein IJA45_02190 [Oscillospiraceae bacterium]|nr:hypothetical protein [Oscillospiraceae bacterium]